MIVDYGKQKPTHPFYKGTEYRYAYYSFNYESWFLISGNLEEVISGIQGMYEVDGLGDMFDQRRIYQWRDMWFKFVPIVIDKDYE